MRELDLSRETIQSQGENIFAHIRHNGLTTKARMHSPDWCKHLAQAAGRSLVSFFEREQQQWSAIGLDHLSHETDEQIKDWMHDHIAHYLLSFYVKSYLKEWAEENAEDIIMDKARPQVPGYTSSTIRRPTSLQRKKPSRPHAIFTTDSLASPST
jgi:type III secretory pathway component EscR